MGGLILIKKGKSGNKLPLFPNLLPLFPLLKNKKLFASAYKQIMLSVYGKLED